jgi:hypothetical protein
MQITRVTDWFKSKRIQAKDTDSENPRKPPKLPVELWITIVEMVVLDTVPTFEECTFTSFLNFLHGWSCGGLTYSDYVKHSENRKEKLYRPNPDWNNLRLTCRTWLYIVDNICKHRCPILVVDRPSQLIEVGHDNLRALHLFDSLGAWRGFTSSIDPYPLHRNLVQIVRSISTIDISISSFDDQHNEDSLLFFLVKHYEYFPSVRSLFIGGYFQVSSWFLSGIEKGFPQLKSLRFSGICLTAQYFYLPDLKVIDFSTLFLIPNSYFPALVHASLLMPTEWDVSYQLFFNRHCTQLESLILWPQGSNAPDPPISHDTPIAFPRLRFFGASTYALNAMIPFLLKEDTRILERVWICDAKDGTIKAINDALDNFKGLKHLIVVPSGLSILSWYNIGRKCRKRGIRITFTRVS